MLTKFVPKYDQFINGMGWCDRFVGRLYLGESQGCIDGENIAIDT